MAHFNLPKSSALSVNQKAQPSADGIMKTSSIATLVDCDISCQRFVSGSIFVYQVLRRFQSKTLSIKREASPCPVATTKRNNMPSDGHFATYDGVHNLSSMAVTIFRAAKSFIRP